MWERIGRIPDDECVSRAFDVENSVWKGSIIVNLLGFSLSGQHLDGPVCSVGVILDGEYRYWLMNERLSSCGHSHFALSGMYYGIDANFQFM